MNNLVPGMATAYNALAKPLTTDEAIKGYLHYLMGGGKPYTEADLGNDGRRDLAEIANNALHRTTSSFKNGQFVDTPAPPDGLNYMDYRSHYQSNLANLIGQVSPKGLRKVTIAGKPYVQVRDSYDFRGDVDNSLPTWDDVAALVKFGNPHLLKKLGVIAGQHVGTPYPINMLIPENPGNVASPSEVNAFRSQTTYQINKNR